MYIYVLPATSYKIMVGIDVYVLSYNNCIILELKEGDLRVNIRQRVGRGGGGG